MKITLLPTEFKWKYLEAIGASCALTMLGLYTLGIAEHQYENVGYTVSILSGFD